MAGIRFIRPIDQPIGNFRLLDWLESNFLSDDYDHFRCLTAFAKIRPFHKLDDRIQTWRRNGKSLEAIIGIDHQGTSCQALQYALINFDVTRILHVNYSTFHPKLYIFYGRNKAAAYCGSGNFTSGGLETNFEGGAIFTFDLPAEQSQFDELLSGYTSLTSTGVLCTTVLTQDFLNALLAQGLLMDEIRPASRPAASAAPGGGSPAAAGAPLFGPFSVKPARPLSKSVMAAPAAPARTAPSSAGAIPVVPGGFVIQLIPHHNGEIFLSKRGVDQNPAFFAYPFTGLTNPKKASNPAYPQRIPDPIVNIRVFDSAGALVHTVNSYPLNMVYYKSKSEIRITITPAILSGLHYVKGSVDYPLLVMRTASGPSYDYDMDFYQSGSAEYADFLALCDQSLPSGGKAAARKMGWF